MRSIILDNTSQINIDQILRWGDDYQLIFTANKKFSKKILELAKKNNIKLSNVGNIIKKKGIFDDSMILIKKLSSYEHFC